MKSRAINAPDCPAAVGGYSQAVEAMDVRRTLYISGQIGAAPNGRVPPDFEVQCRLTWHNIEAQLRAGGMNLDNLVKVTTYLADRNHASANSRIRQEILGARKPALTVVIAAIFDESWLLEIEGIALD